MSARKTTLATAVLITVFVFVIACSKKDDTGGSSNDPVAAVLNLPATPYNYSNPSLPAYLVSPNIVGQINNNGNPVTDIGATLGRVLFYDKNLSLNNSISCASCHIQANGFTDPAIKSTGFNGGLTARHSMSLINAKYYPLGFYFWDQRARSLEQQTLMPIQDLVEMGMTLPQLETKLATLPYYPALFEKVFGDGSITSNRIALALSQYVRSIVSYQSKYDAGRGTFPAQPAPPPNAVFPNFTALESRG